MRGSLQSLSRKVRGNDDSTAYSGQITRPFPFPQHGMVLTQIDDWQPCRIPQSKCPCCKHAPMVVALHYDCFHVFRAQGDESGTHIVGIEEGSKQNTTLLDELWTLGAWRRPWLNAAPVLLDDAGPASYGDVELAAFGRIATVAGLPQLTSLPLELTCLIHALSAQSLFWRSIRCLSARAKRQPDDALHRNPLKHIVSWKRGHPLPQTDVEPSATSSSPPIVRISLDRQGIVQIEQLHHMPVYKNRTTTHMAFIVERMSAVSRYADMYVEKKNGLARLVLSSQRNRPCIWNTSAPLDTHACAMVDTNLFQRVVRLRHHVPSQLYAVETNRCFGLTFFCLSGKLFGIHIHRTADDDATTTYRRLVARVCERMVWVFLPIPPKDRLVALWACRSDKGDSKDFSLIARMKLAGDLAVGNRIGNGTTALLLACGERVTLVYGEQREGEPVRIVGAYSGDCPRKTLSNVDMHTVQDTRNIRHIRHIRPPAVVSMPTTLKIVHYNPYVSSAPLSNVISVRVFHVPSKGICRGLLLFYSNGCMRALGQCRISDDDSWVVANPAAICHRPLQYHAYKLETKFDGVAVSVAAMKQHSHDNDGWICHNIGQGVLHFHYTDNNEYAIIYEAQDRF